VSCSKLSIGVASWSNRRSVTPCAGTWRREPLVKVDGRANAQELANRALVEEMGHPVTPDPRPQIAPVDIQRGRTGRGGGETHASRMPSLPVPHRASLDD
jgi:hypothetical protein